MGRGYIRSLQDQQDQDRGVAGGPTIAEYVSTFSNLPGLRGLWYPGSMDQTGAVYDQSGQGRTLTYNGNPIASYHATQLVPRIFLDGTGDYFSRADEAGLDVLGTETYNSSAYRGLTLGGWFLPTNVTGARTFMSKWTAAGNLRSWLLAMNGTTISAYVSSNGTAVTQIDSTVAATISKAHFVCLRYSSFFTELAVFVNGTKTFMSTAPASIFNTSAALQIGATNVGTELFIGNWHMSFMCAIVLNDQHLKTLFTRTRLFFGV